MTAGVARLEERRAIVANAQAQCVVRFAQEPLDRIFEMLQVPDAGFADVLEVLRGPALDALRRAQAIVERDPEVMLSDEEIAFIAFLVGAALRSERAPTEAE